MGCRDGGSAACGPNREGRARGDGVASRVVSLWLHYMVSIEPRGAYPPPNVQIYVNHSADPNWAPRVNASPLLRFVICMWLLILEG